MKLNRSQCLTLWLLLLAWPVSISTALATASDPGSYSPDQALSTSQAAIGRTVANYAFTDSHGQSVDMADFLGKPLVVSFIYTSCLDSCPIITQTLAEAAGVAREALGDDSFSVISVGFDSASDDPGRMRDFAASQGIDISGWRFLSGDLPNVLGLSENLGFVFYPTPGGIGHLSQVTVIDRDGQIYRQVYGQSFNTPMLVEPLKELVFGTAAPFSSLGDLIKKVRLFCTIYDPVSDRYRFDYSLFIQLIIGALIVGAMSVFVAREWWRIWRSRNRTVVKPPRDQPSI